MKLEINGQEGSCGQLDNEQIQSPTEGKADNEAVKGR